MVSPTREAKLKGRRVSSARDDHGGPRIVAIADEVMAIPPTLQLCDRRNRPSGRVRRAPRVAPVRRRHRYVRQRSLRPRALATTRTRFPARWVVSRFARARTVPPISAWTTSPNRSRGDGPRRGVGGGAPAKAVKRSENWSRRRTPGVTATRKRTRSRGAGEHRRRRRWFPHAHGGFRARTRASTRG